MRASIFTSDGVCFRSEHVSANANSGLLALNIVSLFLDIFQSDATGSTSFRIVANAYAPPPPPPPPPHVLTTSLSITTNLIARFILDLRHGQPWYARTNYEPDPDDMDDIHFAHTRSLVGNMGATLRRGDSTWYADLSDESAVDSEQESSRSMRMTQVERGVNDTGLGLGHAGYVSLCAVEIIREADLFLWFVGTALARIAMRAEVTTACTKSLQLIRSFRRTK